MSLRDFNAYENITRQMENSITSGRLSHAYIIEGSTTSGKFELAINFIKAIICEQTRGTGCDNCPACKQVNMGNYQDLHIVGLNPGKSFIVVDQVAELMEQLSKKSFEKEGYKFVIIKDADKMNKIAQNKILKTLEEPYPKTVIILLSENDNNLLQTIRSRCIIYRLNENQGSPAGITRLSGAGASEEGREPGNEFVRYEAYEEGGGKDVFGEVRKKAKKEKDAGEVKDLSHVAAELLKQRQRKVHYYTSFKFVEENVKSKQEAEELLNQMTYLLRDFLVGAKRSPFPLEQVGMGILLIEEARKDLKYNVNYKYALNTLILKIGG